MTASVRSSATGKNTGGSTTTFSLPSGIAAGDLLLVVWIASSLSAVTTDHGTKGWWRPSATAVNSRTFALYARIYNPSDASTVYTLTQGASANAKFIALAIKDHSVTVEANIQIGTAWRRQNNGGSQALITAPGLTTSDADRLVLAVTGEASNALGSYTVTTPNGFTIVTEITESGTASVEIEWLTAFGKTKATAGAVGDFALTYVAGAASLNGIGLQLSIPPAASPRRGFANVREMLATPGATWAHRGGSATLPEMSQYAYEQCRLLNYPVFEFSAQRSSDGWWFGLHDDNFDRISGVTGSPSPSTLTRAQIESTYQITLNAGGTPRPFWGLIDFLDTWTPDRVVVVDPKNSVSRVSEFLDILDAHGGPSKIVVKFSGVGSGSAALADGATARGYQTWGYFYEADVADGDVAAWQSHWSILGMEYGAAQSAWDAILAYGKPVVGHIAASQANYNTAISKGARMVQVSGVASVAGVGPAWGGVAESSWLVGGAVAGSKPSRGTVAGSWLSAGSAAGVRAPRGVGAGSFAVTGAASGGTDHDGAAAGAWSVSGAAGGTSTHRGSVSGSWAAQGAAAGGRESEGVGAGATSWIGSASSSGVRMGSGAGSTLWTGGASGLRDAEGSAGGTVVFSGSASGGGQSAGVAAGSWSVGGAAEGARAARGAGTSLWLIGGAAAGARGARGTASGGVVFAGSAVGAVEARGAAAGSWDVAGSASSEERHEGSAAGAWQVSGSSGGRAARRGTGAGSWAVGGTAAGVTPPRSPFPTRSRLVSLGSPLQLVSDRGEVLRLVADP